MSLLIRIQMLFDRGPTLMTSFNLNYPTPKYSHIGG